MFNLPNNSCTCVHGGLHRLYQVSPGRRALSEREMPQPTLCSGREKSRKAVNGVGFYPNNYWDVTLCIYCGGRPLLQEHLTGLCCHLIIYFPEEAPKPHFISFELCSHLCYLTASGFYADLFYKEHVCS